MKRIILSLTVLLTINTITAQTLCDTRSGMVFIVVDHPPKPNLTDRELENRLNSVIDPILLESYKTDFCYITYFVNCKGEDFNYKLLVRKDDKFQIDSISNFQHVFLSNMQSLLSWSPGLMEHFEKGKKIEKAVDFQGSYSIRIEGNKLYILNEKEKKKHF
jgi:hypothetical protein